MGDRANVRVRESAEDPGVYLYTHWAGSELPDTLQRALTKRWRWGDAAYLARIIFCEMVRNFEAEETGYGISAFGPDGRDRILEVNTDTQTVTVVLGSILEERERYRRSWTFEEYCALDEDALSHVWHSPDDCRKYCQGDGEDDE